MFETEKLGRPEGHAIFKFTFFAGIATVSVLAGCQPSTSPLKSQTELPISESISPAIKPLYSNRLANPVTLDVAGQPLVFQGEVYHKQYPAIGDVDGDGLPDLLIGDHKGRLHVHRNIGTATEPKFTARTVFDDTVPTGMIPYG
jgi:hypothetical protein